MTSGTSDPDPSLRPSADVRDTDVEPEPTLSVVVVVVAGASALKRSLDALAAQCDDRTEVLVPYARDAEVAAVLADRPWVRALPGGESMEPAALRALAVAAARGAVIACTEDHCVPAAAWCARICAMHALLPHPAIGGVVEKREPDGRVAWATFLTDYGRYMPPRPDGLSPSLTDCNVSYKREALAAVQDAWRGAFHETAVHGALRAAGGELWLDSSVVVSQSRPVTLGAAMRDRFMHGRLYAGLTSGKDSLHIRGVRALGAVLLPPLLVIRALRTLRRRESGGKPPAGTLAALACLSMAWAAGESAGYAAPPEK